MFRSSSLHYCKTNSKRQIQATKFTQVAFQNLKTPKMKISRQIFFKCRLWNELVSFADSGAFYPMIQYLFVQEVQVKSIFATKTRRSATKSSTTNGLRLVIGPCVFVYTEIYPFNSTKHDLEIAKLLKRS